MISYNNLFMDFPVEMFTVDWWQHCCIGNTFPAKVCMYVWQIPLQILGRISVAVQVLEIYC